MNAIFLTQSNSLNFFYDLYKKLYEDEFINSACFFVSDPYHYQQFLRENPNFEKSNLLIFKEWEMLSLSNKRNIDTKIPSLIEDELNLKTLWPSVIANRRIFFGSKYAFRQDYTSEFTHEEILSIQSVFYSEIYELFKKFNPEIIFSFICTTTQEYICDELARDQKIPHLNLRPTRVENFMHFATSVHEPSERLIFDYNENINQLNSDYFYEKAEKYLNKSNDNIVKYEGVFLPSQKPPQAQIKIPKIHKILDIIRRAYIQEYQYRFSIPKGGNVLPGFIKPLFYRMIVNPISVLKIRKYLLNKYIATDDLIDMEYAFYPLHIEPEVTLLVYSRYFLNQIEVIRNIAFSLPFGMKLIIKEHPAAVGKRPLSYYKKILAIPNVEMIDSSIETKVLIKNSKLVATISGSVGLEGIIMGKPVIIFGNAPYQILPETTVKQVENLSNLHEDVSFMLRSFKYDPESIKIFIASIMRTSVPIDFYTTLLGRSQQYQYTESVDYEKEISKLAEYSKESFNEIKKLI